MADSIVQVRYFAAARAAAGVASEHLAAADLSTLLEVVAVRHGEPMNAILGVSSLLLDGQVCHDRTRQLHDVAQIDVLPLSPEAE